MLGNDNPIASVPGEVVPSNEFYDYAAKYIDGKSALRIPAQIAPAMAERVRDLAVRAFQAIDGAGLARVDFLLSDTTGELYLNELNTMPGFTDNQHVSEAVGSDGHSVRRVGGAANRAGNGAPGDRHALADDV